MLRAGKSGWSLKVHFCWLMLSDHLACMLSDGNVPAEKVSSQTTQCNSLNDNVLLLFCCEFVVYML